MDIQQALRELDTLAAANAVYKTQPEWDNADYVSTYGYDRPYCKNSSCLTWLDYHYAQNGNHVWVCQACGRKHSIKSTRFID